MFHVIANTNSKVPHLSQIENGIIIIRVNASENSSVDTKKIIVKILTRVFMRTASI